MKGRIFLIALLALALAQAALATTPLQEKAIEALKQAHDEPNGSIYEHGGMIVANQGTLRYIEPHPDNAQPDGVIAYDKSTLLAGDTMVATYHTHPCMVRYFHQYFSVPDVIIAIYTTAPAFMLDECTGDVHEFFTAIDKVHETGGDVDVQMNCKSKTVHLPTGRIVGNIGVKDPPHVNSEPVTCPK
jgi:hypothetical protein